MLQYELPEYARQVLRVDEEEFRELVRELVRGAKTAPFYGRAYDLGLLSSIILVATDPDKLDYEDYDDVIYEPLYEVSYEIPYCQERYGDRGDRNGGVYISFGTTDLAGYDLSIDICIKCRVEVWRWYKYEHNCVPLHAALVGRDEEAAMVETKPRYVYNLYRFLYKELGTGARPLLELARKAEEAGDKEIAGALRRLYALLEASKDIIDEIEQADYSGVKADVDEREVEEKVEEAVGLLREAKRAARGGDAERLRKLLEAAVVETPGLIVETGGSEPGTGSEIDRFELWEIIGYLTGLIEPKSAIAEGIETLLSYDPEDLGEVVREADIYDAIITVAEHFGLEVMR